MSQVPIVPCSKIILKIHLQVGMLPPTLVKEDTGNAPLLSIRPDSLLLVIHQIVEIIGMQLLSNTLKWHLVLAGDSNSLTNIHLGIEMLMPLSIH